MDNTDQFHLSQDDQPEDGFIGQVQSAITLWGMIVLATGGYLKQSKCQVCPVLFRFIQGRAVVKKAKVYAKVPVHHSSEGREDSPYSNRQPLECNEVAWSHVQRHERVQVSS